MKLIYTLILLLFSSSVFAESSDIFGSCKIFHYEYAPGYERLQTSDDHKYKLEDIESIYHNTWFHINLEKSILVAGDTLLSTGRIKSNFPITIENYFINWMHENNERQSTFVELNRVNGILDISIRIKRTKGRITLLYNCKISKNKLL